MYEPLKDASILFRDYMNLTKDVPRSILEEPGRYRYPDPITQTDMLVFAGIYSNVWQIIGKKAGRANFAKMWERLPNVFWHIQNMTVPEYPHCPNNAFRTRKRPERALVPVTDFSRADVAYDLCQTLRDGLSHFQYRFINETPNVYFRRVDKEMPGGIPNPGVEDPGYRIFIYDEKLKNVIDVGFAFLRLNLFNFLKYFFAAEVGLEVLARFDG